jgi:hypothetical protein
MCAVPRNVRSAGFSPTEFRKHGLKPALRTLRRFAEPQNRKSRTRFCRVPLSGLPIHTTCEFFRHHSLDPIDRKIRRDSNQLSQTGRPDGNCRLKFGTTSNSTGPRRSAAARSVETLDPTNGSRRGKTDVRLLAKGSRWPQLPALTSWKSGISSRLSQPPSYATD